MKKLVKKAVALVVVTALALTTLVGCASKTIDNSEVVATVGDGKITAGLANFYVRYQQAYTESMYASWGASIDMKAMWESPMSEDSDATYEEDTKDAVMEALQELILVTSRAEEYKVSLTDEEIAAVEAAADEFVKANDEEALAKVSGDKETVVEYLKLILLNEKMYDAMVADVDTNVTDEEAAQKRMRYAIYETTTTLDDGSTMEMSDEEKAELKKEAEAFLAAAKENGSMSAYAEEKDVDTYELTFDKDNTSLDSAIITAADALKENAFSDVIETKDGYYVVQLESTFDEKATETKKDEIVTTRQNEKYEELVKEWKEAVEINVNEDVWEKISLADLGVTSKVTTTEDTTTDDTAEEDTTEDDATEEDTTAEDTTEEDTTTEE